MKATIEWAGEASFRAHSESGHVVTVDGPPEHGGHNRGPRPMELVLMGTGACSAFDVVHILRKGRHEISGCTVALEAERAPSDPKVFTRIHLHYRVSGRGLSRETVERAVRLSAEKYCSASIMLAKTARLTHDFEIVEE